MLSDQLFTLFFGLSRWTDFVRALDTGKFVANRFAVLAACWFMAYRTIVVGRVIAVVDMARVGHRVHQAPP